MCWTGSHRVPGIVAATAIVAYVAGLPTLTFWWLLRDPSVKLAAAASAAAAKADRLASTAGQDSQSNSEPGGVLVDNPMVVKCDRVGQSHRRDAVPSPPPPSPDPLLSVFFYDYKPSAWYTKHIDLGLLLILSLFRALLPRPATLGMLLAKTTTLCIVIIGACVHVLWARPYLEADSWMGWVRGCSLHSVFAFTVIQVRHPHPCRCAHCCS